jgi:hypothetical protein
MTIHELMNRSPVSPDITIRVFTCYGDKLIYEGNYEDTTPSIFNLEVWEYEVTGIETRDYNPGHYYLNSVTIYADTFSNWG